jgi:acyl carrier protein
MADVNEVGAVMQVFRDAAFSVTGKQLGELGADSAFDALGIDSVDTIEIVVEMERTLELRFDDRDLGAVRTLGDVAALVARKRAPR